MALDPRDVALDLMVTSARFTRFLRWHSGARDMDANWRALSCLEERGPMRVGEFALQDRLSQPAATAKLNRLAAAGLAERQVDPSDARACLYELTDTGRAHLAELRESALAFFLPRLEAMDEATRAELSGALRTVERLMTDPAPTCTPAEAPADTSTGTRAGRDANQPHDDTEGAR
ncbi:MarR family winged helix-turn-helix transcriptional regulator [Raineyella fluvialis]|uniref:MarR family transcriptional regulator n=1 Tax=Raineyella fluvialis TaxID=2662261 RepID=A0A5Q2FH49_9ACTN|nr:MarR family transcriptional regulator [Raineyella fluvialis]QGF23646.1 MarR family transcriptional regulator [Raineyella fluvialis]